MSIKMIGTLLVCLLAAGSASAVDVFLPSDYDGTRPAENVTDRGDFVPICAVSGGLSGLDLVRAFNGSSTCQGNTASQRFSNAPNFTLLVDDSRSLSPYLLRQLRRQNALENVGGREVVKPTRVSFSSGAVTLTVLIVGEFNFQKDSDAGRWFAALQGTRATLGAVATTSGGSGVLNRVEWSAFRSTPQYQQFVDAIRTLRSVSDESNSDSWSYWAAIHRDHCPHHTPYFLGWHRGYVYLLEQKIQDISGNPDFRLPYWNYYGNPTIPTEFTQNPGSNPLFHPRMNTNVSRALWPRVGSGAFDSRLVNFQAGQPNAFEPVVEQLPHDPVHGLIGGDMGLVPRAANDPIFWVHHANVDRLWSAWIAAGGGRGMPPDSHSYWSGRFDYGNGVTVDRNRTIDSRRTLGYYYDDTSLPSRSAPRPSSRQTGGPTQRGAMNLRLDERSFATIVPMSSRVQQVLATVTPDSDSGEVLEVVFSGIRLTQNGEQGGYFYMLYANLPDGSPDDVDENHFIGTLGPFEVTAALQHRAQGHGDGDLKFEVPTSVVAEVLRVADELELSFIRVNGEEFPRGDVIAIESIELRTRGEGSQMPVS